MASKPNIDNFTPIGLSNFFGGSSVDPKLGTQAQFSNEDHTDFRSNPSNLTVLPGMREITNGVADDLVLAIDQVTSGIKYAAGDGGSIYEVSTAEVWSQLGKLGEQGGAGLVYRADLDNVYISGQTKLARIKQISTNPQLDTNFFTQGVSTCTTCSKSGGSNSYAVPTTLNETQRRSFTSDIEPLSQIGLKVLAKGSGNWTLTLHDDANNVLGTVTVTNANLTSNKINYFVFATPVRIQRGDLGAGSALTYHFHVTSTVADGTLATTTVNSLSDCDMELWASALVPTQNKLHPMSNFLDFTLIGNGRYLATYEPLQDSPTTADYNRHALTFPPGFEVCGIAQRNLMSVIGCEKRSASGEFQEGALFFWDGVADGYNDWWPVPEGSPETLFSSQNTAYYIANGVLTEVQSTDQPIKIRTLPNTNSTYSGTSDITHVYPNMMTIHRGIMLMGYPSVTSNQSLEHGIYSYGVISREYPLSFGYGYTASPGNILNNGSNNLRLGMIKSYGDKLYLSWRDDSFSPHHYGVDIVDNTSSPAAAFSLTALVFDDGRPYAYKNAGYMIATFDPWPAGATLTLAYKLDNDSDFTYSDQTPAVGDQYIIMPVDRRFLVATYKLSGTCTTTSPTISSFYMFVDPLLKERAVGG